MNKYIVIITDKNDADYETTIIGNASEDFQWLMYRLVEAITIVKKNGDKKWYHNWPMSEYVDGDIDSMYAGYLTKDEIMWICDEIPPETHTIEKIYFLNVSEREELL